MGPCSLSNGDHIFQNWTIKKKKMSRGIYVWKYICQKEYIIINHVYSHSRVYKVHFNNNVRKLYFPILKKLIFLIILIQAPTLHKYIVYTFQLSKFGTKFFNEQFPKMQVGQQKYDYLV
jgi:hypothetical protein